MELEDAAIPGDLGRVVQVDAVDETDEHEAKWDASGVRCEDVAEELDSLRRVELGRLDLSLTVALDDGRAWGGAEVAHPVDLAPRRPHEQPAIHPEHGDRRRSKQPALPAADQDDAVRTQRHAMFQEEFQDLAEQSDMQGSPKSGGVGARRLQSVKLHRSHPFETSCHEGEPPEPTDVTRNRAITSRADVTE